MADLNFYANIAEIVGTLTIIGGGIFGAVQLLEFRGQRRDAVAVELMRSFYNPEFSRAVTLIRNLPDGHIGGGLARARSGTRRSRPLICMMYETMGLLVYRRIASFGLAQELTGGLLEVLWRKLGVWVATIRQEQSHPRFAEWFEWLAIQFAKPDNRGMPAHEAYRDWKP